MSDDSQTNVPQGRNGDHPEENEGSPSQSPQGVGGEKKAVRFPINDWGKLTAAKLPPCGYALCRSERADGMAFYVWKGDDQCYYSPVFADKDEAVKWPDTNLFKEISPEVLAQQCREQGFAP